jgi:tRNA(fMet)-specific endonuclease VapC
VKILLDTNAYSGWKRGHTGIVEIVRGSEHVLMSSIVIGELLFGFRLGALYERNASELREFLDRPQVSPLPVTPLTAERFGRVAAAVRRRGKPIPTNDVWIAAHALESGADLVSFDRHFERIEGVAWVDPAR